MLQLVSAHLKLCQSQCLGYVLFSQFSTPGQIQNYLFREKTAVEKREKELRAKLKDQNDSNKKNKMLSMKNERSGIVVEGKLEKFKFFLLDSQNPAQNSPPKNGTGKLANHQQTGPKTKSKVSFFLEINKESCLS